MTPFHLLRYGQWNITLRAWFRIFWCQRIPRPKARRKSRLWTKFHFRSGTSLESKYTVHILNFIAESHKQADRACYWDQRKGDAQSRTGAPWARNIHGRSETEENSRNWCKLLLSFRHSPMTETIHSRMQTQSSREEKMRKRSHRHHLPLPLQDLRPAQLLQAQTLMLSMLLLLHQSRRVPRSLLLRTPKYQLRNISVIRSLQSSIWSILNVSCLYRRLWRQSTSYWQSIYVLVLSM